MPLTLDDQKRIAKVNVSLRRDLGEKPLYAWVWGEDIRFLISPQIANSTADRKMFLSQELGLWVPENQYVPSTLPHIPKTQWVFCMKLDPGDPDIWHRTFNGLVAYPPEEYRMFPFGVDTGRSQYPCMLSFVNVDQVESQTPWIVSRVREMRKMSGAQLMQMMDRQEQARVKQERDRAEDMMADLLGERKINPFDVHIPGKKDKVSFGGIDASNCSA